MTCGIEKVKVLFFLAYIYYRSIFFWGMLAYICVYILNWLLTQAFICMTTFLFSLSILTCVRPSTRKNVSYFWTRSRRHGCLFHWSIALGACENSSAMLVMKEKLIDKQTKKQHQIKIGIQYLENIQVSTIASFLRSSSPLCLNYQGWDSTISKVAEIFNNGNADTTLCVFVPMSREETLRV